MHYIIVAHQTGITKPVFSNILVVITSFSNKLQNLSPLIIVREAGGKILCELILYLAGIRPR